jgi:hypothetical protein
MFTIHPQWLHDLFLPTDTATNHLSQGVTLYEAGKYEEAVAEYTKAIELDPKLATAYYGRGLAYFKMKQYDSALADFNKALELDPRSSAAWVGRGIALEGLGKYKEALEAYNKALELDPNDQTAKSNKDRLLAYLASLPIRYNRGQFGLKTTTTQTGAFKITRTTTCTTYGYPFDLKLYRAVLSGQTIYIGTAETTLHYEGDWSVAVIRTEEGVKVDIVGPSSGHVSGNVKAVILGVWKEGYLGLTIWLAEMPPEARQPISVEVRYSSYDEEGNLMGTSTGYLLVMHPFYDITLSFLDASFGSSPYVTEGEVPRIPTNIEEISKMDLDEYLSLVGYKWTKIRFSGATALETYFSGASAFLNPPKYPDSKSEYINGYAQFESNFIPDP